MNKESNLSIMLVFTKGQHHLEYHKDADHVVILDNLFERYSQFCKARES